MSVSDKEEALREFGRTARERREGAGISLEHIYERTRVRAEYLRGIEEGNYQDFPDLVYTKGFVRTYLGVIGAEDMKNDFLLWLDKEVPKEQPTPANLLGTVRSPTKGFKPVSHLGLFTLLILVLAGTGGYVWYSWTNNPDFRIRLTSAALTEPGVSVERTPSADAAPAKAVSSDAPVSPDQSPLTLLPPSLSPQSVPVTPSLLIKAQKDVWMEVAVGEKVVFHKILKAGLEVSWDIPAGARVTYGRTNVTEVVLNGKNLGLPNRKGSKTSETYEYNPDGTYRQILRDKAGD
ncbi:MAG: DUF4115 domain-containing protein [Synergistaceae bacterium]|nr:DUF4115 domain-containing protein [Synergistaceae bacterium]